MSGPLADLRVIELCDELGQYAGKLLGDLGADVVKVEPPGGSSARAIGPFVKDIPGPDRSLNFWYHNTNKRSVVLDIEGDAGDRARFAQLCAGADVLIEDRQPGALAALGLGEAELRAANPRLIVCSITPFGQTGPWKDHATSDLVALALGGPMVMNGYDQEDAPGAPPIRGHGDQGYNTASHHALHGILAALFYRDRTGAGQYIDCSMHEALSQTVEVGMPYWLYARTDVFRQTARHAAAQRTEPWLVHAKDGKDLILFGVGRDNTSWKQLKKWYQAAGFGLQFDEPRFDEPLARQGGTGSPEAAELRAETAKFVAAHDAEAIYRGGQERDQAWGVIRAPDETLADPHWWDRGHFVHTTGEGVDEPVAMPGAPYLLSATPWELRRPAPKLGEHTAEVLAELASG
ncbi:MAG: CoA transferase [Dehalococcoidia bacterium]|nr:CoA transferase [Dehalococcoidia bacterium]